jgi:hypothetical protein
MVGNGFLPPAGFFSRANQAAESVEIFTRQPDLMLASALQQKPFRGRAIAPLCHNSKQFSAKLVNGGSEHSF